MSTVAGPLLPHLLLKAAPLHGQGLSVSLGGESSGGLDLWDSGSLSLPSLTTFVGQQSIAGHLNVAVALSRRPRKVCGNTWVRWVRACREGFPHSAWALRRLCGPCSPLAVMSRARSCHKPQERAGRCVCLQSAVAGVCAWHQSMWTDTPSTNSVVKCV